MWGLDAGKASGETAIVRVSLDVVAVARNAADVSETERTGQDQFSRYRSSWPLGAVVVGQVVTTRLCHDLFAILQRPRYG